MGKCSSCKRSTTEKGITFHRFPANELERQKWTKNMGRPEWIPTKTAVLCSNHFTSDCFERWWNMTRLHKGSVPTIFTQNATDVHINSYEDQASNKRLKVNVSQPTTSASSSEPISRTSCAQAFSSVEAIDPSPSPEISIPSWAVSTPKSSTCQKQLTLKTSRRRELLKHDHHYEDTPRTSQKKFILMRQKYESSQKKVKALKRQVSNLKITVYSLKKMVSTLNKKKTRFGNCFIRTIQLQ